MNIEQAAKLLEALGNPTRLEVYRTLVRAGSGGLPVGGLQEKIGIAASTLSHHLDLLRRAGLVESRKEERYIYYSVKRDEVTALVRLLTACC